MLYSYCTSTSISYLETQHTNSIIDIWRQTISRMDPLLPSNTYTHTHIYIYIYGHFFYVHACTNPRKEENEKWIQKNIQYPIHDASIRLFKSMQNNVTNFYWLHHLMWTFFCLIDSSKLRTNVKSSIIRKEFFFIWNVRIPCLLVAGIPF